MLAFPLAQSCLSPPLSNDRSTCIVYPTNEPTKQVYGLNGSGKSPKGLTLEKARAEAMKPGSDDEMDSQHVHCVTGGLNGLRWVWGINAK